MPFKKNTFEGTFTASEEGKSHIFKQFKTVLDKQKNTIFFSILEKALPLLKSDVIDLTLMKRVTKITFKDEPLTEVYFFDKDLPTEIFIAEIKLVFSSDFGVDPFYEVITNEKINYNEK
jgi:hypothetical protein